MLGGCVGRVEGIDGCIGDEVIFVLALCLLRWEKCGGGSEKGKEAGMGDCRVL